MFSEEFIRGDIAVGGGGGLSVKALAGPCRTEPTIVTEVVVHTIRRDPRFNYPGSMVGGVGSTLISR